MLEDQTPPNHIEKDNDAYQSNKNEAQVENRNKGCISLTRQIRKTGQGFFPFLYKSHMSHTFLDFCRKG